MHQILVTNVAVGENYGIHRPFNDQILKGLLGKNRDAVRIGWPCQRCWIAAVGDAGNLRSREADHPEAWLVTKHDVEVMEIPSSSAKEEYVFHCGPT